MLESKAWQETVIQQQYSPTDCMEHLKQLQKQAEISFEAGKQEGQQESINALNDYAEKRISLERCCERMDMNIYELLSAFRQWESTLQ